MKTFALKRGLLTLAIFAMLIVSLGGPRGSAKAAPLMTLTPAITATTRVSVASDSGDANDDSFPSAISADGRYVVFASKASDLVAGDTNVCDPPGMPGGDPTRCVDIFRRDMQTGTTIRVSIGNGFSGVQANKGSDHPSVSEDGNLIAFESSASNLLAGADNNGLTDIFIRNVSAGTTTRVSISYDNLDPDGWSSSPVISTDGHHVAFISAATNLVNPDSNGKVDVFIRDLIQNKTYNMSIDSSGDQANDYSDNPAISTSGRYVVYESRATDLIPGGTTVGRSNIYLHDRDTDHDGIFDEPGYTSTTLISKNQSQNEGNGDSSYPTVSGDGQYVAFKSAATDLVSGDTNNAPDIFVRNTVGNTTTRVSIDSFGNEANDYSSYPMITNDGKYVAFISAATNLVVGDTNGFSDAFVRDMVHSATMRVSVGSNMEQADAPIMNPEISSDGTYMVFDTYASNLVSDDTNDMRDIYFVPASGVFLDTEGNPTQVRVSVDLLGLGPGSVTSMPGGISCGGGGSTCVYWFNAGSDVTLTATKGDAIVRFAGWGGDCSGTILTCSFTNLQTAKTVSATFLEYWIYLPLMVK